MQSKNQQMAEPKEEPARHTEQDLGAEATDQASHLDTVGFGRSFICLLRCLPVRGSRVLSEGSEVGANAAASWAAHSYRSAYHGVAEGIGGVGGVSRSGADAAVGRVHALASLRNG